MRIARIVLLSVVYAASLAQVVYATEKYQHEETVFIFSPRELNFPEYLLELQFLNSWANQALTKPESAGEALERLRGGWTVKTDTQSFSIDTGWLTDEFEKLQKNPTTGVRDDILQRLNAMKADAAGFQNPPADTTVAHQKLKAILARSEFRQVHGATWWDRMWSRIESWIYRNLGKMFGSSAAPTVGHLFVWTLVGVAVLALAYFVFRTIRQNARLESIMPEVVPVSAKQWRVWLKEAREASEKGKWRDAVHLAYWGGISFLEESGMWRPDQARTPREYLRLLPAESQHRNTLKTLTRRLEVTWYGNEVAGPEAFSATVANLEELGCRD